MFFRERRWIQETQLLCKVCVLYLNEILLWFSIFMFFFFPFFYWRLPPKTWKASGIWKQMRQEQSHNNFLIFWFTQIHMIWVFVWFGMICSFRRGVRRFILSFFPLTKHTFYVHTVHGPKVICKGYDFRNVYGEGGGTFESNGVCVILARCVRHIEQYMLYVLKLTNFLLWSVLF